jgi:hypothetical protein
MMGLNDAVDALTAVMKTVAPFRSVSLQASFPSDIGDQPALFIIAPEIEFAPRVARGAPPKRTILVDIWIFDKPIETPETFGSTLRDYIDAVDTALRVPPGFATQTLGGAVSNCWIEGKVMAVPGHQTGQAFLTIPVRIEIP